MVGMAASRKFIIDCDTGVDDAVALLMACNYGKDIEILAVTCVNGNSTVDQAVHNTLLTLGIAKKKIPVYRGCSRPLSAHDASPDGVHASDGLSGAANKFQPFLECKMPGNAVTKLVELVNEHQGEITLVALGPLTNIAMAYRMDDDFSSKLKNCVIMGGNTEGRGNIRIAAEFNFWMDPEAAQIVVEETACPLKICGWELCGLNCTMTWDWYDNWMNNSTSERGDFIKTIVDPFVKRRREKFLERGFAICDPLAMAIALDPKLVVKSELRKITVETAGLHTRGMMVIGWVDGHHPRDRNPVEIVLEVNKLAYANFLESLML